MQMIVIYVAENFNKNFENMFSLQTTKSMQYSRSERNTYLPRLKNQLAIIHFKQNWRKQRRMEFAMIQLTK